MIDVAAATLLLRHARPSALQRLAKMLRAPTGDLEALAVALDAALAEGPMVRRPLRWRVAGKRTYAPIFGQHAHAIPRYGDAVICLEGNADDAREIGVADLRPTVRTWACDVAARVIVALGHDEAASKEAIALARKHREGKKDRALDEAREAARARAFERLPENAAIAARTIVLNATLEDAWEAGYYVMLCAMGWAQREITALAEEVGKVEQAPGAPPPRSHGLNLVMDAQWMQLSAELEDRAIAVMER